MTAHQPGCEESKLNYPRDRADNSSSSGSHTGQSPRSSSDLIGIGDGTDAYTVSPPPPLRTAVPVRALSERGVGDTVSFPLRRLIHAGAQERKGFEGAPGSSPSPPPAPWCASSPTPGISIGYRRRRPGVVLALEKGGVRGEREGTEGSVLPPCPVCFDRLDPSVVGLPVAARAWSHDRPPPVEGVRCNHRSEEKAEVLPGKGPGGQEEKWRLEGVVKGRERTALNVVMWKGSDCRVCRSLNVSAEGAQDVVRVRRLNVSMYSWTLYVKVWNARYSIRANPMPTAHTWKLTCRNC